LEKSAGVLKMSDVSIVELLSLLANLATVVGGLAAIAAIIWAVRSHKQVLWEQKKLRSQDAMLSLTGIWNGPELLSARMGVARWLPEFPANQLPKEWLEKNHSDREWTKIATIAHFIVSVEYLIEDGNLEGPLVARHLGGGAWWARELLTIYGAYPEEKRIQKALTSFMARYPVMVSSKVSKLQMPATVS
jgi:hypothetical protein